MTAVAKPSLPEVGEMIDGKYRVLRRIADGGMGVVYEAVHERLGQLVAIKAMYPHYCQHPEVAQRFHREGRIAARLQGPNTPLIHDIGTLPNGVLYMVMEMLCGQDVEHLLQARGALPISLAIDIVYQAAAAMAEAHSLGVVHRDLKPGNLFLCDIPGTERKLVKVLDFGISRFVQEDAQKLTADLTTLGTPFYMAPEQVRGAASADARSDIWSLGIIFYELLTGVLPFQGKVTEVLVKVATDPIAPPSKLRGDIPPGVEAILMRALEKSPASRFQSMGELRLALAPLAPEETVESLASRAPRQAPITSALAFTRSSYPVPPTTTTTSVRPARPPRRLAAGVAAAVAFGLVALVGGLALSSRSRREIAIEPAQAAPPLESDVPHAAEAPLAAHAGDNGGALDASASVRAEPTPRKADAPKLQRPRRQHRSTRPPAPPPAPEPPPVRASEPLPAPAVTPPVVDNPHRL